MSVFIIKFVPSFSGETTFESTPFEEEKDFILVRGLEPGVTYDVRVVAVDGKHERASRAEEITMGGLGGHGMYIFYGCR